MHIHGRFVPLFALFTCWMLSPFAFAAEPPVRVLIFSGQNNHDWTTTTPKLKAILESAGRFTVDVTDCPDQCDAVTFAKYDVIVSNWNNWGKPAVKEWPVAMREAFLGFVRDGKGLVVVHAGGSSFYEWPEYHKLAASWGKATGHGPVHEFEVKPASDHLIVRGIAAFRTTDELWHGTACPPDAHVLATAFSSKDRGGSGRDEPVALMHNYGKGRCFNLVLGHHVEAMEAAGFQSLLVRGTEWAATGKVTAARDQEAVKQVR